VTLRQLWLGAMARREQMRISMLPHICGKFDRARFIRTGYYAEFKYYPPPDTPAMREAREAIEKERAMHQARTWSQADGQ
jgi:hypothetical protein